MILTPQQRIDAYARAFPKFPAPYLANGRIEGLWIMGNCYQTSGYYGAYPHGYLDRVMAMFPDAERVLHVFSGSLPAGPYTRFEINVAVEAEIHGNAEELSQHLMPWGLYSRTPERRYQDLILADPPYSMEDADHYGRPMVNRNRVLAECLKCLSPGGWVIWLDQVLPMFRKTDARLALAIGMVKSTNHRVRCVFGFQKAEP